MTSPPKENKDEKFTLRLDKKLKAILDLVAENETNMNKSQILREALQLWINMRINAIVYPGSDLCMFSLNMLKKALKSMNEEELQQLSKLAFENAKKTYDGVTEIFKGLDTEINFPAFMNELEGRLNGLINAVYGPTGYRWFDSIEYEMKNGKVMIDGKHRLGSNFTQFFRFHISNHMEDFDYELKSISTTSEMKKDMSQMDQIHLIFVKGKPN
ncbi:MAG: ribbon-helix-helix domain-containing protein [Promethearchaeota archaeon]